MELKLICLFSLLLLPLRLNRTFYGIETVELLGDGKGILNVLIVPFMELKPRYRGCYILTMAVLIVPFMELKQRCRIFECRDC